MPVPGVWGPVAWSILHTIGDREKALFPIDGFRETIWLLKNLECIIPCPECRDHIKEYKKKTPYPNQQDKVGKWFWEFHDAVNKRLEKNPSPSFSNSLGTKTPILVQWKKYKEIIKESILIGHLNGEKVKEWERHLYLWKSFS